MIREPYKPGELVMEHDGLTWVVKRDGGAIVAQCDHEEAARLLCAAPGMLEALRRVVEGLEPCIAAFNGEDMADVPTYVQEACGVALLAIAAAERGEGSE